MIAVMLSIALLCALPILGGQSLAMLNPYVFFRIKPLDVLRMESARDRRANKELSLQESLQEHMSHKKLRLSLQRVIGRLSVRLPVSAAAGQFTAMSIVTLQLLTLVNLAGRDWWRSLAIDGDVMLQEMDQQLLPWYTLLPGAQDVISGYLRPAMRFFIDMEVIIKVAWMIGALACFLVCLHGQYRLRMLYPIVYERIHREGNNCIPFGQCAALPNLLHPTAVGASADNILT